MKHYFNIYLETQKDSQSEQIGFVNKHKFQLQTTMFGEDINTSWMSLGIFINKFRALDSLKNLSIDAPLRIESAFENNIKINFIAEKAEIGKFYTLGDYDNKTLGSLDSTTLKNMDSNIEEG